MKYTREQIELLAKGNGVVSTDVLRQLLAENDALVALQNREIADARGAGEEFFFEIPDSWYEPTPTYGCENGHASRRYLKSEEHGKLCLACGKRIVMLPIVYDTDEKLTAALEGIAAEAQRTQADQKGGE